MIDRNRMGQLLQFHIDSSDPATFVVGQPVWQDEKWFLIQRVSPYGRWNGLGLYLHADLVAVETDSEYLEKMNTLLRYRSGSQPVPVKIRGDGLCGLLTYAQDAELPVGLELCMSGYRDMTGWVVRCDGETVCLRQVDEYGKPDGFGYVAKSAVTRCFVGDEELECLSVLAEHN